MPIPNPHFMDTWPDPHMSMGITAENVAEQYGISREDQDLFSMNSHLKAAKAQAEARFDSQIILDAVCVGRDAEGRLISKTVPFTRTREFDPTFPWKR